MKGVGRYSFLFLLSTAVPFVLHAQVVVNEIMYNPAGSDSGREWVELYNQGGSDVTLVGGTVKGSWRIADSSNHTLTDPAGGTGRGSLVVPAGGYLVIASDPTEFISGEYAGGAYSVAKSSISLNNSGATVSLVDGTGAVTDSIAYTSTQGGSDDGSSLQRQADGSWIAALPTPGTSNSSTVFVPPPSDSGSSKSNSDSSTTTATQTTQTTQSSVSSYVAPPVPSLYADAGADRTVIVGADSEFNASAYDKNQDLVDPSTVRFSWNFGDGTTGEGESVLHHYQYPGKYVLVLNIALNKNAAMDEMIVTAEPAKLSFSVLPDGGVEIDDLAGRDLDLSGWLVRQAPGVFPPLFTLPPHSLILSGSSMHISRATLGFIVGTQTELDYPNGVAALIAGQTSASTSTVSATAPAVAAVPSVPVVPVSSQKVQAISASIEEPVADTVAADETPAPSDAATTSETAAAASAGGSNWWWLAAIALAAIAAGALVFAKKLGKKEWDIVEEK